MRGARPGCANSRQGNQLRSAPFLSLVRGVRSGCANNSVCVWQFGDSRVKRHRIPEMYGRCGGWSRPRTRKRGSRRLEAPLSVQHAHILLLSIRHMNGIHAGWRGASRSDRTFPEFRGVLPADRRKAMHFRIFLPCPRRVRKAASSSHARDGAYAISQRGARAASLPIRSRSIFPASIDTPTACFLAAAYGGKETPGALCGNYASYLARMRGAAMYTMIWSVPSASWLPRQSFQMWLARSRSVYPMPPSICMASLATCVAAAGM